MGYYVDDPNGGPPQYHEGFDPAQGQSETGPGVHTSKKRLLWEQGRNFLVPAGVMGAEALLAGVNAAGSAAAAGASPTAVAGGAASGGVGAGTAGLGASSAGAGAGAAGAGAGAGTAAGATGGGLLASLTPSLLDYGAKALQGYAAGQTANRGAELNAQRDYEDQRIANNRSVNESALADVQQRKFLSDEAQRNRGNAVHGGYLSGVQDVNITPPPGINMANITGGLRPSAISGKDEMGKTIQSQAMKDLLNPQQLPPVGSVPPAPQAPKGAGAVETGTGIAATILPWLSPFLRPNTTPPPVSTTPTPLGLNPMQGTSFRY